jgi:hypothetical protein
MIRIDGGAEREGLMRRLDAEIARLEELAADLRTIRDGGRPAVLMEGSLPLMDSYGVGGREVPCLIGRPQAPLTSMTTTELVAVAPDEGWVRTRTRFIRLGRPLHSGGPDWRRWSRPR